MRRLKELLGLIPRLLIIGVELFAMYSFYMVFETMLPRGNEFAQFGVIEKILYLTFEETYKIAILIFGAYIFSIIAIVISWIFNFATEFDDYDYFFDRFRVIPYAPIALILRTLKHIKLTVVFFFETLFDADLSRPIKVKKNYTKDKYNDTKEKYDNRSEYPNYYSDAIRKAAERVAYGTKPANLYGSDIDTDWDGTLEYYECLDGTIGFSGTIVYKAKSYGPAKIEEFLIEECEEKTRIAIKNNMKKEIEKLRKEYKGFDKEYNIEIYLSRSNKFYYER